MTLSNYVIKMVGYSKSPCLDSIDVGIQSPTPLPTLTADWAPSQNLVLSADGAPSQSLVGSQCNRICLTRILIKVLQRVNMSMLDIKTNIPKQQTLTCRYERRYVFKETTTDR